MLRIRFLVRAVVAMVAMALACVAAFGQGDSFDRYVADISILQAKPIQKEMGVTEAQRKRMNVAADAYTKQMRAYSQQLRASGAKQVDRGKILGYQRELRTAVFAQLSAGQIKRLRELSLQARRVVAVTDKVIADKVGLSPAQLKQVRTLFAEGRKHLGQMQQEAAATVQAPYRNLKPKNDADKKRLQEQYLRDARAMSAKLTPRLEAYAAKNQSDILAVLTPKQRAAWKALEGKPFKF